MEVASPTSRDQEIATKDDWVNVFCEVFTGDRDGEEVKDRLLVVFPEATRVDCYPERGLVIGTSIPASSTRSSVGLSSIVDKVESGISGLAPCIGRVTYDRSIPGSVTPSASQSES